jgi:8-oxo-dGTP diphosphatase
MTTHTYDSTIYDRPDGFPVDNCIFTITTNPTKSIYKSIPKKELKVLLIKRKVYSEDKPDYPEQGKWAFPGGFSERDEDLDEAAKRELQEEANVGENIYQEQFGTIYYPGRDTRGWLPTTVYVSLVPEEQLYARKAGDDAAEVGLFTLDEIKNMDLAFDHKKTILGFPNKTGVLHEGTLGMIQRKMLSEPIAKEFLRKQFTISELLQIIETVVPHFNVQKPNFIKKVVESKKRKGLLIEALTEEGENIFSAEFSQRPAKLYKFNPNFEVKMSSIYNSTFI